MDVFEAIHDRRSIRRYCPDPADRSLLEGLFGTISMLMLEERPTAQVESWWTSAWRSNSRSPPRT